MAFAIQELLKLLDCSAKVVEQSEAISMTQGKRLSAHEQLVLEHWNRLTDEARVVVRPFLTSTYELCDEPAQPRTFGAPPLYLSTAGKHWLSAWCARLMSLASGDDALLFRYDLCVHACGM